MCVLAVCLFMSLLYIPELKPKPYVIDGGARTVHPHCTYELRTHSPAVCSYSVPASYDSIVAPSGWCRRRMSEEKVEA